jgi:hypothetical protein
MDTSHEDLHIWGVIRYVFNIGRKTFQQILYRKMKHISFQIYFLCKSYTFKHK